MSLAAVLPGGRRATPIQDGAENPITAAARLSLNAAVRRRHQGRPGPTTSPGPLPTSRRSSAPTPARMPSTVPSSPPKIEPKVRMTDLKTLMTGLAFGESPRWHDDRLWFSNWGAKEVIAVDPQGNSEVVVRVPTSIPFCIDWLPDGRLLIVSGPERTLLRLEPDGSLATHADLTGLSDHALNEIVVDGRGNAYVNGAGFDLIAGEEFAPGLIALVAPGQPPRQVADGMAFPNGMAITPDDTTLIVAESYARRLTAFDIQP